ncbi:MAG: hypothetical protein LBG69_07655 [Zoogloeaceae bacterium]|jgi:hypothetical protein|nr:hypothetical protein [Zoogloeaceae bacterium]
MALSRKTVKIGDIFQTLAAEGVCYGQITHKSVKWGYVVAVFREFFVKEPVDFTEVLAKESQFITAFLINIAVRRGLFSLVANFSVAENLKEFPIFRSTNYLNGNDTLWFLGTGRSSGELTELLRKKKRNIPGALHA